MRTSRIQAILVVLAAGVFSWQAAFGQIKGKVRLSNTPSTIPPHVVTKNTSICGGQVLDESLLVSKKLELRNAFVFLANIEPDSLPPVEVTVKISECVFRPHLTALLRGDHLVIENDDPTVHHARGYLHRFRAGWQGAVTKNVFDETGESVLNFVFPSQGSIGRETLREPGLLELHSEIGYDWMKAYVLVMPHRFFAITNAKGEFELKRVPPGRFDLVLWHEALGVQRQLVEVAPGKKTELLIEWDIVSSAASKIDSSARADKQ